MQKLINYIFGWNIRCLILKQILTSKGICTSKKRRLFPQDFLSILRYVLVLFSLIYFLTTSLTAVIGKCLPIQKWMFVQFGPNKLAYGIKEWDISQKRTQMKLHRWNKLVTISLQFLIHLSQWIMIHYAICSSRHWTSRSLTAPSPKGFIDLC